MPQADDTKVQDNKVEGQPQSDMHADSKPTEDESKTRTAEQFEKLTAKNKELSEKLAAYEQQNSQSVIDSLKPKAEPPINQSPASGQKFNLPSFNPGKENNQPDADLVDQEGFVNADVLKKSLSDAQQKALQAEKEARIAREQFVKYEENQQIRAAHEKFPQLDPHNKQFDKTFYDLTRNELIGQMIEGKKDVIAAAEKVAKLYHPANKEDEQKKQAEEKAEQKMQINAGNKTSTSPSFKDVTDDDLIRATRSGKKGALAERLRRSNY